MFNDPDAEKYEKAAHEIHTAMHEFLYDKKEKRFVRSVYYESGHLKKDMTIDSTSLFVSLFDCCNSNETEITATVEKVREKLWVPTGIGGVARYEGDSYHRPKDAAKEIPGNPWFICTIWLGKYYVHSAKTIQDLEKAVELMRWVTQKALSTGVLPEQIHPTTGIALSVSPLTWSHAEFVEFVVDYLAKRQKLTQA